MARVFWAARQSAEASDKASWIVESLASQRSKYTRAVKMIDVGENAADREAAILDQVHTRAYIESMRAESLSGVSGDRSSCSLALSNVRALCMAAAEVSCGSGLGTSAQIVGSLAGGMHHATASAACHGHLFNGLAVAAALPNLDTPVLVLDLDGTCGGGTASMIRDMPHVRQLDIAVSELDSYADTPNACLRVVSESSRYLEVLRTSLSSLESLDPRGWRCIYSAGIDGSEHAERGLAGMTAAVLAERDRIVFEWCLRMGMRTAYALGCGDVSPAMPREAVVALHRQTIEVAVAVMREQSRN
jgi:acetoin utilization deacetylase AcuC-like enzyme